MDSGLLPQLELVLIEEDGALGRFKYEQTVHRALRRLGFVRVWRSHDTADPGQKWSDSIEHSAWRRASARAHGEESGAIENGTLQSVNDAVESNELCRLARHRNRYSKDELNCFEDTPMDQLYSAIPQDRARAPPRRTAAAPPPPRGHRSRPRRPDASVATGAQRLPAVTSH